MRYRLPRLGRLGANSTALDRQENGLTEPETAVSVDVLKLLPAGPQEHYRGRACLRKSDQKALSKSRKCLRVREGEYARLLQRLYATGIQKLVLEEPKEINKLLASRKAEVKRSD